MALSLSKALTEAREIDLGHGVKVTVKPVGYARFARLNAESILKAQAELAGAGEDPAPMAVAELSQVHLDRSLVVESITAWTGLEDEAGNAPPVTAETWSLFADLHPGLASVLAAEIRQPGLLAAAEGNASAPSPNGDAAGAPNTADPAPSSPDNPSSPAPATPGTGKPARKKRAGR